MPWFTLACGRCAHEVVSRGATVAGPRCPRCGTTDVDVLELPRRRVALLDFPAAPTTAAPIGPVIYGDVIFAVDPRPLVH